MNKSEVVNQIKAAGVIPIIRTKAENAALQAIEAVSAGGLNIFEVTMTVPNAIKIIENLKAQLEKNFLIGAGTVLDAETADNCIAAGAEFIVSPIFDPRIVSTCQKHDVTVIAGAMTVTEIFAVWRAGADFVKVFPADALGGASYLKAVKTVLPEVALIPTGGVTIETAADFIKAGAAAIGIGSDLINQEWLQTGRADEITSHTQTLVEIIKKARE
ncbi:MAG: bifunctional 4-hydroxy-2-oxoglutarate aldolase/2-dehydro-3-deoxy-phosphogluconate aldolase [Pyrinomonadaceae bacterium]